MATANGSVSFEAGGQSRFLRFTTNALCHLEDKTGSTILKIGGEIAFGVSMTTLRAMFWAGVGGGDITQAQAGEMIDDIGISEARRIAVEAFEAAFPTMEASDGEGPPKAAAG